MMKTRATTPTPTPIPIFAPVDNPDDACDEADGEGDEVEVEVEVLDVVEVERVDGCEVAEAVELANPSVATAPFVKFM